ncbi:hypothetical protein PybrP1_000459 [[Pythium] brassicae (nom. inval.)]|nr:hypothetical protein PybrP1_000459 [[Pythium] brassicae (nom. inval.)]
MAPPYLQQQLRPQPKRRGRKAHLPTMTNSERGKYYRGKHKRHDETLTKSVGMLRARVERLRAVWDICSDLSLSTRMNVSLSGPLVRLVHEYFAQFHHGVQLAPAQRTLALPTVEVSTAQQDVFMRAVMEPDVGFGEYAGIDVIMDQWTRYSEYHALLVWELEGLEISGCAAAPIVTTSALLRTRYSRKTIENVFPHVAGNEPLIQRLVGREVVYPSKNQFYFNAAGRVERYDVEADFAGALVRALGSTEDAALLLGQALIQQQHMMGALDSASTTDDDYNSSSSSSSRAGGSGEDHPHGHELGRDARSSGRSHSRKLEVEYLLDCTDA